MTVMPVIVVLAVLAFGAIAVAFSLHARLGRERAQTQARLDERDLLVRAQATASERERIYGDLHDDLGAKLLGLVHSASTPQQADQARALLQDLRDVVTRSRGTPGTLGDVLGDIRAEIEQRLRAIGVTLEWQVAQDLPDPALDTGRALHLQRILREAISNVIHHAQARHVRVRVAANDAQLRLELTDDGSGAGVDPPRSGSGLRGMRERAAQLAGDIDWKPGTVGGTKVLLTLPLGDVQ
ncbi:MAG: hypothetical protein IT467_07265 [Dokdonella sp.]|uniref:sensor histidine kinase n=1 Tax=Dokdonella sp. TaxID=2291710 RepID=UPI0025BB7703|nr:ATP-binding protein [Dokdonella sp.]MBZ0222252.1 hypothetical protein [Dokdonella sp.]MCC7255717.1 hypothetical protein [Dokdonella sp.]